MQNMKTWDVIIVGAGIIGLSLSIALRKRGLRVLIVERGEPGREASHAAAGMLADCASELPSSLLPLAVASARMYPEFVHELHDESGVNMDLREDGALLLWSAKDSWHSFRDDAQALTDAALAKMEPSLNRGNCDAFYRKERSVDPRALTKAAILAARHREVDMVTGAPVTKVEISHGSVTGVSTEKSQYSAPVVVNCAGAWAGHIEPYPFVTRPVKGQMLALVGAPILRHVIRAAEVYLVPRSDGRILIGSTLEDAGYDKRVDTITVQRLHQAALNLVPPLRSAKIHEDWAGLRPGTLDHLPIMGETPTLGYFAATGHYRDGILLTPITAKLMAQVVTGEKPEFDINPFSPLRFQDRQSAIG
jgi:glycine oxidase